MRIIDPSGLTPENIAVIDSMTAYELVLEWRRAPLTRFHIGTPLYRYINDALTVHERRDPVTYAAIDRAVQWGWVDPAAPEPTAVSVMEALEFPVTIRVGDKVVGLTRLWPTITGTKMDPDDMADYITTHTMRTLEPAVRAHVLTQLKERADG